MSSHLLPEQGKVGLCLLTVVCAVDMLFYMLASVRKERLSHEGDGGHSALNVKHDGHRLLSCRLLGFLAGMAPICNRRENQLAWSIPCNVPQKNLYTE